MTNPSNIVYVNTDGSGDYNCDGKDDHIQINEALEYAGRAEIQGTVYLQGPNTYVINGELIIKSDTELTGDSTACIKLANNSNFKEYDKSAFIKQLSSSRNIKIHGFEIDGNNAGNPLIAMWKNSCTAIKLMEAYNVHVYDMYIHHNQNDCIFIHGNNQDINSSIHDNHFYKGGHEAIYLNAAHNVEIYNNSVYIHGNSGFRLWQCDNFSIHDNNIYDAIGGTWGIVIDETGGRSTGGDIYNNVIHDTNNPGIMACAQGTYAAGQVGNLHIYNNVIYNTVKAGIEIHGWEALIENNTIDACYENGIQILDSLNKNPSITGTCKVTVRNNIITNTLSTGRGIAIYETGHKFILEYNNVWNNSGGNYYGVSKGDNDLSVDPLYANLANHDYHLKSKNGRWHENGWVLDEVTSPMIGAGNPTSSYSKEPQPNGGRVNIGAYGNTIYASKSSLETLPPPPPPPPTPTLKIVANPTTIIVGKSTNVTFAVTRMDTNATVSGATVTLSGAVSSVGGTTNESGNVVITVYPVNTGTIIATVIMTGFNNGSTYVTVTPPPPTPPPTITPTLKVAANPNTIIVGESTNVTFTVTRMDTNATVSGATVTLSGVVSGKSGITNIVGSVVITVNPTNAGIITATVSMTGFNNGSTYVTVTQPPPPPPPTITPTLKVVANPTMVTAGESTDITFIVTRMDTNATVSGATVALSGAVSDSSEITNLIGNAIITVNPVNQGTITATASMEGFNNRSTYVTVTPPPTPPPPTITPTLEVVANPTTVTAGESTNVTFTVTRMDTNATVSGATVTLSGAVSSDGEITNEIGNVVISVNPVNTGTIITTASMTGFYSRSTYVTVTPPTSPPGTFKVDIISSPTGAKITTTKIKKPIVIY